MNKRILLDTDMVVYALNHDIVLSKKKYAISILTEIAVCSHRKFESSRIEEFYNLLKEFKIYQLNDRVKETSIELKHKYALSLDESIICSTALVHQNLLITKNRKFSTIPNLNIFFMDKIRL